VARRTNSIFLVGGSANEEAPIHHAMAEANVANWHLVCRSAEDALSYLAVVEAGTDSATHPLPGLVILSVKSPDGDGLDVIKWMRSQPRFADTPVVILAPGDGEVSRTRLDGSKANLVLFNPVPPERLKAAVETYYDPMHRLNADGERSSAGCCV
jgi:DNA-binding response OmpR family regulator